MLDPTGDQKWSVTASFAKYVAALEQRIADSSSAGGNPQTFRFVYRGPSINADPTRPLTGDRRVAIRQIFDWYFANGGANLPFVEPARRFPA